MASIRERVRKGRAVYCAQIRVAGHGSQTRTFTSKREADQWVKLEEGKIVEGRGIPGAEARRRTLADAVDQYLTEKLPTLRSPGMHSAALAWWKERIGKMKLADITAAIIVRQRAILLREKFTRADPDAKRSSLKEGEAPKEFTRTAATANRYVAVLSSCLSACRREWHWTHSNPCEEIAKLPERPNRARVLTPAERKALLAATLTEPTLHLFTTMALSTACRAGELVKLRWQDVDLDQGQVVFRDTKNGQARSAWLPRRCRSVSSRSTPSASRTAQRCRLPKCERAWTVSVR